MLRFYREEGLIEKWPVLHSQISHRVMAHNFLGEHFFNGHYELSLISDHRFLQFMTISYDERIDE